MILLRRCGVLVVASVLAGACSGSSFNGISGGDDGGAAEGSTGGEGGGADARPDVGPGGDDAATGDAKADVGGEAAADGPSEAAADVVTTGDAPSDGPAAPCPTVAGAYTVTLVEAQGCGDLNPLAAQCIVQDVCTIQFQSNPSPSSVKAALNGDPTLAQNGSFSGAALKEGTGNRTGCTGTWNGALSTMSVDCGGTGSSQACVVALTRTGDKCP
jgi:hypothetical protein